MRTARSPQLSSHCSHTFKSNPGQRQSAVTHAFPQRTATCEPRFLIHELGLKLQPSNAVLLLDVHSLTCRSRNTSRFLPFPPFIHFYSNVKKNDDINSIFHQKLKKVCTGFYNCTRFNVINRRQLMFKPVCAPG